MSFDMLVSDVKIIGHVCTCRVLCLRVAEEVCTWLGPLSGLQCGIKREAVQQN